MTNKLRKTIYFQDSAWEMVQALAKEMRLSESATVEYIVYSHFQDALRQRALEQLKKSSSKLTDQLAAP